MNVQCVVLTKAFRVEFQLSQRRRLIISMCIMYELLITFEA